MLEAREWILNRLLADGAMKRTIVDELVSDYAWDRKQAWAEVRAIDDVLAAERGEAARRGESVPQSELLTLTLGALDLIFGSGSR